MGKLIVTYYIFVVYCVLYRYMSRCVVESAAVGYDGDGKEGQRLVSTRCDAAK